MSIRKADELMDNPEFQSALVRLGIWLFTTLYIGIAASSGYFNVDISYYVCLMSVFFVIFISIFLSIFVVPRSRFRKHFSLVVDITGSSLAIYLTSEAVSPFYLLYIWIFVSYGTRYGKEYLKLASLLSVLAYSGTLLVMGQFSDHVFEAFFFLVLLVVLPYYQYILIRNLQDARIDAERSSKVKTAFLSNMTHELRTPLSGIVGMAELLKNTKLDAQQRDFVEAISSSGAVLNALIGDVLDVSKIEADKLVLEERSFNLAKMTYEVVSALASQASERGLELICELDDKIPLQLMGDELRVRQILFNLLGNALKFTHKGEVIVKISWHVKDECQLLMEVIDTGIGLSAEKKKQIFESFWQGENSRAREYGGTGLGTTIVRNLVQGMLGTINIISEEGVGTTFQVLLPLKEIPGSIEPLAMVNPLSGKRVLVYEANHSSMQVMSKLCERLGVTLIKATEPSHLVSIVTLAMETDPLDVVVICDTPLGGKAERVVHLLRDYLGDRLPVLYVGYQRQQTNLQSKHSFFVNKPVSQISLGQALSDLISGEFMEDFSMITETLPKKMVQNYPVLMAEDNAINAKVLQSLLEGLGCTVSWAKNGQEALKYVKSQAFSMAFIDLQMPIMDGIEFTKTIRLQENPNEHLQIVALTANISIEAKQECLEAGMDDFLHKPVQASQLVLLLKLANLKGKI